MTGRTGPASRHGRFLSSDKDLWTHNAWDNIEWDDEMKASAVASIEKQRQAPVPEDIKARINADPAVSWDEFYKQVKDRHFQDRAWLKLEFPELEHATSASAAGESKKVIAELGSGPGNTTYPLLANNENNDLFVYSLDFSKEAINMVKSNPAYDERICKGIVWDLASSNGIPSDIPPNSVDIVIMIFVFSALHPKQWTQALLNIKQLLKPGGSLLFRDYGRWDMAQLRFKSNRLLEENLYIRGDETRVYFFEKDELSNLFQKAGFEITALDEDKRLLLNRKRQVKMNRVWLQGRFKSLESIA